MTRGERVFWAVAMTIAAGMLIKIVIGYLDCEKQGGMYVRGLFTPYHCIIPSKGTK